MSSSLKLTRTFFEKHIGSNNMNLTTLIPGNSQNLLHQPQFQTLTWHLPQKEDNHASISSMYHLNKLTAQILKECTHRQDLAIAAEKLTKIKLETIQSCLIPVLCNKKKKKKLRAWQVLIKSESVITESDTSETYNLTSNTENFLYLSQDRSFT